MTSVLPDRLLQCCSCGQDLNLESHTLACLCNVCNTCMEENRLTDAGKKLSNGKCPKCREVFSVQESNLSPFLTTKLKQHLPLECRSCSEDNAVSAGKLWCQECGQIYCHSCNRVHMKFAKSHSCKDLDGVSRSEWIEQVMSEECVLHGKECNLFCNQCNTCFCDVCYSGGECPLRCNSGCVDACVISVKDEVVKQKNKEGPIMEQEVKKFADVVKESNEKLKKRNDELNKELHQKCREIWKNYDEKVERAWRDAADLCNQLEGEMKDEEAELHDQLTGNEALLSQIEMWLLSCQHLLHEAERNVDILCGLHALKRRVQSWQEKWNRPEKIKKVEYPALLDQNVDSSLRSLDQEVDSPPLLGQNVDSSLPSLDQREIPKLKGLRQLEKFNLEDGLEIKSIHVAEEDGHIFLCANSSLIELSEMGELLHEFRLKNESDENSTEVLRPYYVCSISPDILVVCGMKEEIYFSERSKVRPFLKTKKIIKMEGKDFLSLCSNNDWIFVLCSNNDWNSVFASDLTISSFTKNGDQLKTVKLEITCRDLSDSKMRVDPMSGNFWVSYRWRKNCVNTYYCWFNYKVVCFNSEGTKISFARQVDKLYDFYFNKFGHCFFQNDNGIYSSLKDKTCLIKLSRYEKTFFVSENKIYIPVKNSQMTSLKIFEILYLNNENV